MDIHLDILLQLLNTMVERCPQQDDKVYLKLRRLNEAACCHLLIDLHPDNNLPALLGATKSGTRRILGKEFESELRPYFKGVAECGYELPSSPTLLPKEKGAKSLVPSPLGKG